MEDFYKQFTQEKQYVENVSEATLEAYKWAWKAFEPVLGPSLPGPLDRWVEAAAKKTPLTRQIPACGGFFFRYSCPFRDPRRGSHSPFF